MTDLETLIELAEEWSRLGWAVQEQGRAVIEAWERGASGADLEDVLEEQNSSALRMVVAWLEMAKRADVEGAQKLADEIEEWLKP